MENYITKAKTLIEALPYIKEYFGKRIVIKYGGSAMESPKLQELFATDIVLMHYVGINPIIIHGGGPQISGWMKKLGMEPKFIDGLRYTDEKTMEVVKMVLVGKVNKEIVSLVNRHGELAVGVGGDDARLIVAKKKAKNTKGQNIDLGFVGDVHKINPEIIDNLLLSGFIPVIASIGGDDDGQSYNINADTVTSHIAAAVGAEKMIILTDVEGIYTDHNDKNSLISELNIKDAEKLLGSGRIEGGMIPKISACLDAVKRGVEKAHILNGKTEHALLLEIFTNKGIGTMITGE